MTNKYNIPFSPPDITDAEINEVVQALKSGWITTGPRTKQFEKNINAYLHTHNCVCLNSQTACSEMALRLLDLKPDDEVIVPSYTYSASASVVCHVGAKLVLCDVQKDSPEIDYDQLESLINEHTKVIIPVDLGGIPCDYDRLFEIVNKYKNIFKPSNNKYQQAFNRIIILADCAHAFGAKYKDTFVGNIADFSSFSFHAVKNITTAEGGCLTWNSIDSISDEEVYNQLQLLSLHGQSKDALHKNVPGAWEYDIVGPWYKCNMTDIVAAVGLKQLERYPSLLDRRREIINKFDNAFKPLGIKVLDHYNDNHISSGHLYITNIPNITDEQRREIITKMANRGISCNVHYKPLPMFTAYRNLGFDIIDYPNAYNNYINEITLPLHTLLTDDEVDYVIENYIEIVKEYIK